MKPDIRKKNHAANTIFKLSRENNILVLTIGNREAGLFHKAAEWEEKDAESLFYSCAFVFLHDNLISSENNDMHVQ